MIVSELLRTQQQLKKSNIHLKIFDSSLSWIFDFSELEYQLIGGKTTIYNVDDCVYDFTLINSTDRINELVRQIVAIDYNNQARMKLLTNGQILKWIVYVVEEAQVVLSSGSLRNKENQFWLRAISTSRNLGLSFIFVGQRLADISSKAIERCQGYLFGKMLGDNDLRKLRGIAGKEISWLVKDLDVSITGTVNDTTLNFRYTQTLEDQSNINHKTTDLKSLLTNGFIGDR